MFLSFFDTGNISSWCRWQISGLAMCCMLQKKSFFHLSSKAVKNLDPGISNNFLEIWTNKQPLPLFAQIMCKYQIHRSYLFAGWRRVCHMKTVRSGLVSAELTWAIPVSWISRKHPFNVWALDAHPSSNVLYLSHGWICKSTRISVSYYHILIY